MKPPPPLPAHLQALAEKAESLLGPSTGYYIITCPQNLLEGSLVRSIQSTTNLSADSLPILFGVLAQFYGATPPQEPSQS